MKAGAHPRRIVAAAPLWVASALGLLAGAAACDDDPKPDATTMGSSAPASTPLGSAPGSAPSASSSPPPAATGPESPPLASASAEPAPVETSVPSVVPSVVASAPPPPPVATTEPTTEPVASAEPPPPPPTPVALPAAQPGTADAIAADVDSIYVPQPRFQATFEQSQRLKVQGKTVTATGKVFVEKPSKVSFRYDNGNVIVADGSTLKTYVKEDEQMVVSNIKGTQASGAVSFLMGNGIRPSFTFEFHDKKWDPGWVLRGTPRQATPHYETVFFFVDRTFLGRKSADAMKTVILLDAQGNRNRFDFTQATFPASIPADVFSFTPPPGTNVVRQ